MVTGPKIKDVAERLKNRIKHLTEFKNARDKSGAKETPNEVLSNLNEIGDKSLMTESVILPKCIEHAIHVMQFIEGKEDLFALGKVFLCGLFLGVA